MAKAMLSDGDYILAQGPLPLDRALRDLSEGASWNTVRRAIDTGKVLVNGEVVRVQRQEVERGSRVSVRMAAPKRAKTYVADDAIVHLDRHIVVVCKPSGIASVPDERRRDGTLVQLVAARLRRGSHRDGLLGVVQRLDIETTGLIVFARTQEARAGLKEQFQNRDISREYYALVSGRARSTTIRSHLTEHPDGKRSSTLNTKSGKFACTHVTVLEHLPGASLIRCRLETGRTHQIRIHLSEAGHPLLGDKRYARRKIATPPAPRVMLHAATLGFEHPISGLSLAFEQPLPEDFLRVQKMLDGR